MLIGAVAWCVVVVVVAIAVWQAIGAAGEDAFGGSNGSTLPPVTGQTTTEPRNGPTPTLSPRTTSPSGPVTTASPPSPGSSPSSAVAQTRSWTGGAGTVVVRCVGATASLQSATPGDGFRVEIDKRGPEEVRVELTRGEEEVRVDARCVAGVPRFSAEERGDSSGSD